MPLHLLSYICYTLVPCSLINPIISSTPGQYYYPCVLSRLLLNWCNFLFQYARNRCFLDSFAIPLKKLFIMRNLGLASVRTSLNSLNCNIKSCSTWSVSETSLLIIYAHLRQLLFSLLFFGRFLDSWYSNFTSRLFCVSEAWGCTCAMNVEWMSLSIFSFFLHQIYARHLHSRTVLGTVPTLHQKIICFLS